MGCSAAPCGRARLQIYKQRRCKLVWVTINDALQVRCAKKACRGRGEDVQGGQMRGVGGMLGCPVRPFQATDILAKAVQTCMGHY